MPSFFTDNNYLNTIILVVLICLLLIILRLFFIKTWNKDKIEKLQAPEMRKDFFVLRDQYYIKYIENIILKSEIIIIAAHGLQGQSDDFKKMISLAKKYNYSLIAYDRRGTGKNFDDFKFNSFATDVNDLKDIITCVKEKYPNKKIFLFGEDLGAAIASLACKKNDNISGLITSNLITKNNLYPFSIRFYFRLFFGFLFSSNIKLPIYLDPEEISTNSAYITNVKQRYSLKQIWTLKFLWQLKIINKKSIKEIRKLQQKSLILQSADDIFADFHKLKVLSKKWNKNQSYHFIFSGKHALINEKEFEEVFNKIIVEWIEKIS